MIYFCVSDIHGYYDVLIKALSDSGYEDNNKNHKLVVVGDMVDRGPQNKEVLEYVEGKVSNQEAILVMGNHDVFLLDFFKKDFSRTIFNFNRNGHLKTITDLYEEEVDLKNLSLVSDTLNRKYKHIRSMLENSPYYYELEKYVFVHGGVNPKLTNWREDSIRNLTWQKQSEMPPLKDKTVICGHQQNVFIRDKKYYKWYMNNPKIYRDKFDIIYGEGVIHIDGSVHTTKKINVLKISV